MLRRFLAKLTSDSSKSGRGSAPQWVAKNQHITNTMTEIQILNGHSDIVRSLIRINASRFASSSDDCSIIVWSIETGEPLMRLVGHASTISCMLLLSQSTLISGSADRSLIHLWDLTTGTAIKTIPDCHHGSIKCLLRLDSTTFMSVGNDKYLNIWKTSGELVDQIERSEQENLNCVLLISNKRVVTAGNGTEMVVYSLEEKRSVSLLVAHREPVRCLINLNQDMFVSASIDGHIIIWSASTLTSMYEFNFHRSYFNSDHVYIYNVHQLVKLSDQYLAACIGSGYTIYKIGEKSAEIVMECLNAHSASTLAIAPLYYGTALVTSSADSTIRLWGSKVDFQFRAPPAQPKPTPLPNTGAPGSSHTPNSKTSGSSSSSTSRSSSKSKTQEPPPIDHSRTSTDPRLGVKYVPVEKTNERRSVSSFLTSTLLESDKPAVGLYPPRLIGDMCCHSDQVNIILPLSPFAFASASSDGAIVVWRDTRVESAFRSELSNISLRQWHTRHIEMSILEATSSQYASTEAKYSLSGSASNLATLVDTNTSPTTTNIAPCTSSSSLNANNPSRDSAFVVFGASGGQGSSRPTSPGVPPNSPQHGRSNLALSNANVSGASSNSSGGGTTEFNFSAAITSTPGHSTASTMPLNNNPGNTQPGSNVVHQKPQSAPNSGKMFRSAITMPHQNVPAVRVPPYIADNAYYMFYELNYSLEQVQEALLAEGNSESIVVAAIAELQQ